MTPILCVNVHLHPVYQSANACATFGRDPGGSRFLSRVNRTSLGSSSQTFFAHFWCSIPPGASAHQPSPCCTHLCCFFTHLALSQGVRKTPTEGGLSQAKSTPVNTITRNLRSDPSLSCTAFASLVTSTVSESSYSTCFSCCETNSLVTGQYTVLSSLERDGFAQHQPK